MYAWAIPEAQVGHTLGESCVLLHPCGWPRAAELNQVAGPKSGSSVPSSRVRGGDSAGL